VQSCAKAIKLITVHYEPLPFVLDPEEAAKLLSVSEDWLYHNAKKLPFTRKLGPRLLRFSYHGMIKWMESKKFGSV
jgi:predicted DNA-binding transcriptional regulator AlpA